MSSFTSPLRLEYIDGHDWKLLEPFTYEVGALGSGEAIHVHAGFITDFASIPIPIRWWWAPASADYGKAAVIHDFLYRSHLYDRLRSDQIFLEGMEVLLCPLWKRRIIYRAVRLGGYFPYHRPVESL